MIQRMKVKAPKYRGVTDNIRAQLQQLDEGLRQFDHLSKNCIYIKKWSYKQHHIWFTKSYRTKRSRDMMIRTVSCVPGSDNVRDQIYTILDKNVNLPHTKKGLAKYLDRKLKEVKLDKYWVIFY
jgi:hypothetical protein